MGKVILYEEDGEVRIVHPAPEFLARGNTLEDVIKRSVPPGVETRIVEFDSILTDRTFRDAWVKNADRVDVDMPKARGIQMNRIREERNKELTKTDIEMVRLVEDGGDLTKLKAKRKALRDIPQTFDLSGVNTPEELKIKWPDEIKKRFPKEN